MKINDNIKRIDCCREGSYIKICSPHDIYRNIQITRIAEGGVYIRGDHYCINKWLPVSDSFVISCATEVIEISEEEARERNKKEKEIETIPHGYTEEEYKIFLLNKIKAIEEGKNHNLIKLPKKDKEAKIAAIDLKYPKGKFTCQEFADLNGIDKPIAYLRIKENKSIRTVGEKPNSKGKGRATKLYSL